MQMSTLVEQLINGITIGSFYALIALGYTMVYGILKMINFAHGEIYMVGAYAGFFALNNLDQSGLMEANPYLSIAIALLAGMAASAAVGYLVERTAYRPLRRAARLAPLISAIGVSLFIREAVRVLPDTVERLLTISIGGERLLPEAEWQMAVIGLFEQMGGARHKAYPTVLAGAGFEIGGVTITYLKLFVIISSVLLMIGLYLLVKRTKLGKAMRAVAEDKDVAALMGIDVNAIISRTFIIGSLLAGAAGVMVGMTYLRIATDMGFVPGIKAFTAAVLGGIGNIPGAVLGGFVLGIAETIGVQFLPAVYKDVVAFTLLVLILIFRPRGLLGEVLSEEKS